MPDANNRLYLYEALELRAEYDARIKTLKDCLPETKQNRSRNYFVRDDEGTIRPSQGFDITAAKKDIDALVYKRRKLNAAIQRVNFDTEIELEDGEVSLSEALEHRSELNIRIGEIHALVVESAFERVIYKEGRDIVNTATVSYPDATDDLDQARKSFRELNRKLRLATFQHTVDYMDES